jgi:molybdopterin-guanine dinucleotide biosynthesis protein A
VALGGRPLILYALAAMRSGLDEVVVQAKAASPLPELPGARISIEPALPRHPLFGIIWALERAGGASVLVCAADMPFVTPGLIARLIAADAPRAAVAVGEERLQPLLGLYRPSAIEPLGDALRTDPNVSLTAAVRTLQPTQVAAGPGELVNINTPDDLQRAETRMAQPNVKS